MGMFSDKQVRNFFVVLSSVLFITVLLVQLNAYNNAIQYKNEMLRHDYKIAGYLVLKFPDMSLDIQKAFTNEKTNEHFQAGQALMETTGYESSVSLALVHDVNRIYRRKSVALLLITSISGLSVLLLALWHFKRQVHRLNQYGDDILRIMNGEYAIILNDQQEGILSKLASAVNRVTSSLYSHVESEKQSRILLKDNLMNISHQLKTPISALAMYIEIMQEENESNEVIRNFLQKSENELERMRMLTANLLKLARLDAGVIELRKEIQSLGDIIRSVGESFKARLDKEQKSFVFMGDTDIFFPCDREWFFEAISNLVKNATEHTDSGDQIQITLEQTPLFIHILVQDNGHGIHPEDLPFVFQRFYRSKYSQGTQGTGIGLTLTKAVIEMHGGLIDVESTVGKGTRFSVRLPFLQNCKSEFTSV